MVRQSGVGGNNPPGGHPRRPGWAGGPRSGAREDDRYARSMSMEPEELEEIPPQGHVKVVYLGPVAPHWEVQGVFGDGRTIDEFRQRALARLQLLPPHDPQFRRNRERVARDAEREHLILEWDLGYEEEA